MELMIKIGNQSCLNTDASIMTEQMIATAGRTEANICHSIRSESVTNWYHRLSYSDLESLWRHIFSEQMSLCHTHICSSGTLSCRRSPPRNISDLHSLEARALDPGYLEYLGRISGRVYSTPLFLATASHDLISARGAAPEECPLCSKMNDLIKLTQAQTAVTISTHGTREASVAINLEINSWRHSNGVHCATWMGRMAV